MESSDNDYYAQVILHEVTRMLQFYKGRKRERKRGKRKNNKLMAMEQQKTMARRMVNQQGNTPQETIFSLKMYVIYIYIYIF